MVGCGNGLADNGSSVRSLSSIVILELTKASPGPAVISRISLLERLVQFSALCGPAYLLRPEMGTPMSWQRSLWYSYVLVSVPFQLYRHINSSSTWVQFRPTKPLKLDIHVYFKLRYSLEEKQMLTCFLQMLPMMYRYTQSTHPVSNPKF